MQNATELNLRKITLETGLNFCKQFTHKSKVSQKSNQSNCFSPILRFSFDIWPLIELQVNPITTNFIISCTDPLHPVNSSGRLCNTFCGVCT
jgi:hypothetical protein